jgi:hypothetical protein
MQGNLNMHLFCNDFTGGIERGVFNALNTVCCNDKMHGKCQGARVNRINAFSSTFLRIPAENQKGNMIVNWKQIWKKVLLPNLWGIHL